MIHPTVYISLVLYITRLCLHL